MENYVIWADGSCLGNPGFGGTAYVLSRIHPGLNPELLNTDGSSHIDVTNNKMELLAVIEAFRYLNSIDKTGNVKLVLDSEYVGKGLTVWMKTWKSNSWKTKDKKPVKNKELWKELDDLSSQYNLEFSWVKGHSGDAINEYVDTAARQRASEIKGKNKL